MMYASAADNNTYNSGGSGEGILGEGRGETIKLDIKHNLYPERTWLEIRFDKHMQIKQVKDKLYTHCGTSPEDMQLYMYDPADTNNQILLDKDEFTLDMYNCMEGYVLFVKDLINKTGVGRSQEQSLNDKSIKYVMPDEEYDKRPDTMRNFIKNLKKNQRNSAGEPSIVVLDKKKDNTEQ